MSKNVLSCGCEPTEADALVLTDKMFWSFYAVLIKRFTKCYTGKLN